MSNCKSSRTVRSVSQKPGSQTVERSLFTLVQEYFQGAFPGLYQLMTQLELKLRPSRLPLNTVLVVVEEVFSF